MHNLAGAILSGKGETMLQNYPSQHPAMDPVRKGEMRQFEWGSESLDNGLPQEIGNALASLPQT
jgi:hypothetical protein